MGQTEDRQLLCTKREELLHTSNDQEDITDRFLRAYNLFTGSCSSIEKTPKTAGQQRKQEHVYFPLRLEYKMNILLGHVR